MSNLTPGGAGLVMKVLWDDNLTPFSSDKIRAKILDLGYGGAHRALHNLCPKSARGSVCQSYLVCPSFFLHLKKVMFLKMTINVSEIYHF